MNKTKTILAVLTLLYFLFACPLLAAQGEKKAKAKKGIVGNWKIVTEQGGRQMSNKLSISEKADGSLRVRWNEGIQDDQIASVKFENNKLSFTRTVFMGEWEIDTDFEATLKDDKLTGTISSERGDSSFTGARIIPKPDCVGVWLIQSGPPERVRTNELVISLNKEGKLEGKWVTRRGESQISNIKFVKGKLSFDRVSQFGEREFKTTFAGQVKANELIGNFKSDRGDREANGKRKGAEFIGRWDLVSQTDRGDWPGTLWIDKDLTATYSMGFGNIDANDLNLEDGKVTFNITFGFGDRSFKMDFDLNIDGNKIKGQSSSDMGTNEITGNKIVPEPPAKKAKPAEKEAKKD